MTPLVTAIVTTYNREPEIVERAIKSIATQDYSPIEIILVNDSPNYHYRSKIDDIAKRYKQIKYIVNNKNMGAAYSRQIAVDIAQGEFIGFLDDDDEWLPNKTSEMIHVFKDDVSIVYSDYIIKENNRERIVFQKEYTDKHVVENLLYVNFIGGFSNPLIRKKAIVESGGMDLAMLSRQDQDLWIRIASQHGILKVNKTLTVYYISPVSITLNRSKQIKGTMRFFRKYKTFYRKYPQSSVKVIAHTIFFYIYEGWKKEAMIIYLYGKNRMGNRSNGILLFSYAYLRKWIKIVYKAVIS